MAFDYLELARLLSGPALLHGPYFHSICIAHEKIHNMVKYSSKCYKYELDTFTLWCCGMKAEYAPIPNIKAYQSGSKNLRKSHSNHSNTIHIHLQHSLTTNRIYTTQRAAL